MKPFSDSAGRTWHVVINVAQMRRVRDRLKVNLYKLIEDKFAPLSELLSNPVELVDVIFVLCEQQAAAQNVTDEMFGQALAGDHLQAAAEAFVEELIDFFPESSTRVVLKKLNAKGKEMNRAAMRRAAQEIDEMPIEPPESEPSNSSGSAPESSELPPGNSPSPS